MPPCDSIAIVWPRLPGPFAHAQISPSEAAQLVAATQRFAVMVNLLLGSTGSSGHNVGIKANRDGTASAAMRRGKLEAAPVRHALASKLRER